MLKKIKYLNDGSGWGIQFFIKHVKFTYCQSSYSNVFAHKFSQNYLCLAAKPLILLRANIGMDQTAHNLISAFVIFAPCKV